MYRLTVHIDNPNFINKDQITIGKDFNNKVWIDSLKQIDQKLSYLRSNYQISKWKEGDKKGKEMIYISYC